MLVDAHLHVWRGMAGYPNPAQTIVSPASDVPLEVLDQYMQEYAVTRAVLVQPTYPGEDNSYVADCAADQPDRFAVVCVVDPRLPGAADQLDYWARKRGCRGLRLRPRLPGEGEVFTSEMSRPLWERARDLGVVVSLLANPEHLDTTATWVEQFPDVPVLLDHMAHPDVRAGLQSPGFQKLLGLARYPRVFVKVTGYYYYSREAYPFRDCWDLFRALYDHFGSERLIWGSDFPHVLLKVGYRRNLLLQERAYPFLSVQDLDRIMGGNAAQLYWS